MHADATDRLTREELYDLVWSEPMAKLAQRYGLSDVGLAKICRKVHVPVPYRGYWRKKEVGQAARRTPLPKLRATGGAGVQPVILPRVSTRDELLEPPLALDERLGSQILAVEPQQVESGVMERPAARE